MKRPPYLTWTISERLDQVVGARVLVQPVDYAQAAASVDDFLARRETPCFTEIGDMNGPVVLIDMPDMRLFARYAVQMAQLMIVTIKGNGAIALPLIEDQTTYRVIWSPSESVIKANTLLNYNGSLAKRQIGANELRDPRFEVFGQTDKVEVDVLLNARDSLGGKPAKVLIVQARNRFSLFDAFGLLSLSEIDHDDGDRLEFACFIRNSEGDPVDQYPIAISTNRLRFADTDFMFNEESQWRLKRSE